MREFWVVMHRWAGLSLAFFLLVCALTGSLLAFYDELHAASADWVQVKRGSEDATPLDPLELMAAVERAAPEARFNRLELIPRPDEALVYFPEARDGATLGYDEIAINPYTGDEVYRGIWGDLGEGTHQLMPFIFQLHYTLALGESGRLFLGVAALVWTIDCLIAFGLTLPVSMRRWWHHWGKAWRMRFRSSGWWRINFDLHRAGGLWLWPLLLVFAWSSVAFNLGEVYMPVMRVLGATDVFESLPARQGPEDLVHDWPRQLQQARVLAHGFATESGFEVLREDALTWRRNSDTYEYRYQSSADLPTEGAQSRLFFDRQTGVLVAHKGGAGDFSANGIHEWLMSLHIASIGGLPYRAFVTLLGLGIAMLVVTGIVIWIRKRSARILSRVLRAERTSGSLRRKAPIEVPGC